ncbi:MAG: C4-type zinc ribbon domain-containing protein [Candidatus Omnitrophica bacterium]|nr:C4-type zinc ribbon domain-containing protein [Candidatus Omnitrophota bacterium]
MLNLEEQIKILVELQGLDTNILRLNDELDSIPEKIKVMEGAFQQKAQNLKRHEENIKSLQVRRKEKEVELQGKEDTIKKYTTQMYQVKTNKEYTALQEEIARIKADNSLIEEEIIKILDEMDAENAEIAKEKDFLKKEEIALSEEKKKLEVEAGRLKEELAALQKQRSELALKVDKAILSKYERILSSKDGLAVVPVLQDSCQGCFRILPPQVINEIKMKSELVVCENCARILYIEE